MPWILLQGMQDFPNSVKRWGNPPPLWGMGNFAGGIFLSGDGDIKSDFDHSNENMKIII